jgi:hypothetical protein
VPFEDIAIITLLTKMTNMGETSFCRTSAVLLPARGVGAAEAGLRQLGASEGGGGERGQ